MYISIYLSISLSLHRHLYNHIVTLLGYVSQQLDKNIYKTISKIHRTPGIRDFLRLLWLTWKILKVCLCLSENRAHQPQKLRTIRLSAKQLTIPLYKLLILNHFEVLLIGQTHRPTLNRPGLTLHRATTRGSIPLSTSQSQPACARASYSHALKGPSSLVTHWGVFSTNGVSKW